MSAFKCVAALAPLAFVLACQLPWGANAHAGAGGVRPRLATTLGRVVPTASPRLAGVAPRAAPVVTVKDVSGAPGAFIIIVAQTDAVAVKWVVLDPGLSLFPPNLLKDARTAVVISSVPGKYRLLAYTGTADGPSEPAVCTVSVGTPPGPGPIPPNDPLAAAAQAAYAQETGATRAADAAAWSAAFLSVAGQLTTLNTNADLLGAVTKALAGTTPGALPKVKAVVVAEMQRAWGSTPTQVLDKTAAKVELTHIAQALGGLK